MGCDAVVALGRATVDGKTHFGLNCTQSKPGYLTLQRSVGRAHAADEKVPAQHLELPQARQTFTVLGAQPAGGWGYDHGINAHQVAAGCIRVPSSLPCPGDGLRGTDLVRLILERCRNGRQALDLLTDLVQRHGQESDHAFVIADPSEAYVIETAGNHWVHQEVREVRAVSNVRVIRQDWDGISSGLASHAIAQGWWPDDGSKLDFAGALREKPADQARGLRRWGRSIFLLQDQNGHIDGTFVRRLLSDHDEAAASVAAERTDGDASLCRHARNADDEETAISFVTALCAGPAQLPLAWCAFGPPCSTVYFPVFLDGDLPHPFTAGDSESMGVGCRVQWLFDQLRHDPEQLARVGDLCARLQGRFDQETSEFLEEATTLKERGFANDLQRQVTLFMQYNLERFEEVLADSIRGKSTKPTDAPQAAAPAERAFRGRMHLRPTGAWVSRS